MEVDWGVERHILLPSRVFGGGRGCGFLLGGGEGHTAARLVWGGTWEDVKENAGGHTPTTPNSTSSRKRD